MVLSLMPCLDSFTCEGGKASVTISGNHDHSKDEGDLCSPFCICSCCGVSFLGINIPVFFNNQSLKVMEPLGNVPYYSVFNSYYYHSFWQPPKLS
ncbi:hypothetical protein MYP_3159 [Sporocytophaga myxococcoides]|uniref:Uncharacterized protein n=2 Tax=Sporocytophaga myxococcoides TaxID=153721 RepID=A0A098LG33_9BACT|nr:hypothetical protein MYP_3159 [Sporocytophaga myxococcoides]